MFSFLSLLYRREIFSVRCNNFFVPVKRIFSFPGKIACSVIEFVDVNKTVAFCHLAGGGGHQIDTAPGGVSHQIHAVLCRFPHGFDVLPQIIDAVGIVNFSVRPFAFSESQYSEVLRHCQTMA